LEVSCSGQLASYWRLWPARTSPVSTERRLSDESLKKCPHCAEFVKREASVCRFCQRNLKVA
jgi:hypothetical protein